MSKKDSPNRTYYKGLFADWYDDLHEDEVQDIEFYEKIVMETDGPVLELACGTGRLLVPYRRQGVDIEGVDCSSDMLRICKRKLDAVGLEANLYQQNIEELRLSRRYQTMFISGGDFQLIDDFDNALQALNAIRKHLLPGGKLVLDLFIPWNQIIASQDGLWRLISVATRSNGQQLLCYERAVFDLEEQIKRELRKYELYQDRQLVNTIVGEQQLRWYGKREFILMMEKAGFANIQAEKKEKVKPRQGHATIYYGYNI